MATAGAHQTFPARAGEANGGLRSENRRAGVGRWTVSSSLLHYMCLANLFGGGNSEHDAQVKGKLVAPGQ